MKEGRLLQPYVAQKTIKIRAGTVRSSQQRVEFFPEGRFFRPFAIVPRAPLQGHMQRIIAYKVGSCTRSDELRIGCVCAEFAQCFEVWNASTFKLCRGCRADAG